jgi:hypothetical protein
MKISRRGIISFDSGEMNKLWELMPVNSDGVRTFPLKKQDSECDWD